MADNQQIFTTIYEANRWGSTESVSGRGSELRQTVEVRDTLTSVIARLGVNSIVDAPCGDFNWMPRVLEQFPGVKYQGFDIVEPIINGLSERYADHPDWSFAVADITKDELPSADLVVTRDCLVHLSLEDAQKAIGKIAASGSRYLLTTHYPDVEVNKDTENGHWHPVNLTRSPFSLPEYTDIFDTDFRDDGQNYPGNHLALWDIDVIRAVI